MYKTNDNRQLSPSDFNQPIGLTMSADNRWVRLADLIPWEKYEHKYAHLFKGSKVGIVAKPFRMSISIGEYSGLRVQLFRTMIPRVRNSVPFDF